MADRPTDTELRALIAGGLIQAQIGTMFGVPQGQVSLWIRDAKLRAEGVGPRPATPDYGDRIRQGMDRSWQLLIDALDVPMHEPRDIIARARLAIEIFRLGRESQPDVAPVQILDRTELLERARAASASAERLRVVGD